jgi:integrase
MAKTHKQSKYATLTLSRGAVRSGVSSSGDQVSFEVSPEHVTNLDFSFLAKRPQMQRVFLEVFRMLGEAKEGLTKKSYHLCIKDFSKFLNEYESKNDFTYQETTDIDSKILLNYRFWLETRPSFRIKGNISRSEEAEQHVEGRDRLARTTVDCRYRALTFILKKARSYHPGWFPLLPATIPRLGKRKRDWKPVDDVLGVKDLERILAAARCEADHTRERNRQLLQILEETKDLPIVHLNLKKPAGYWNTRANAVHSLIRENGIIAEPSAKLKRVLLDYQNTSPTELFRMYVPVGESSLLPFALQLYILTGLNVTSLRTLTRDCIGEYPRLPQYKRLIYDKPRSGASRAKTQVIPAHSMISSDSDKESVLSIIEFLIKWTEPLVDHVPERLKNNLFLYRSANRGAPGGQIIRALSKYQAFEPTLPAFIDRYRKSHKLPKFSLRDLRPAVATYLYFKTRDIYRVQRFLGHRSIRTTIAYIRGRIIAAEHDKSMAGAIDQIIRRILQGSGNHADTTDKRKLPVSVLATIVEGKLSDVAKGVVTNESLSPADAALLQESGVITLVARCRRPDKPPPFLKVPPGQICTKIFKCLSCPNAAVLEEDLPYVFLRIRQIWDERKRLSEDGWHVLYADVWLALNQVTRLFSKEARDRATKIMEAELLPLTEETPDG